MSVDSLALEGADLEAIRQARAAYLLWYRAANEGHESAEILQADWQVQAEHVARLLMKRLDRLEARAAIEFREQFDDARVHRQLRGEPHTWRMDARGRVHSVDAWAVEGCDTRRLLVVEPDESGEWRPV